MFHLPICGFLARCVVAMLTSAQSRIICRSFMVALSRRDDRRWHAEPVHQYPAPPIASYKTFPNGRPPPSQSQPTLESGSDICPRLTNVDSRMASLALTWFRSDELPEPFRLLSASPPPRKQLIASISS